ncbi:MAG: hypothetical protein Q8841_02660, partial [Candidatus Phytoplasma australasiaticum]|nr:hypothetical protein [Candidatus Phytoplasma australasiaticum]
EIYGMLKTHELEMEQRSKRKGGMSRTVALKAEEESPKAATWEGLSQQPQAVIDSTSVDDEAFTHPVPSYQLLAEQGNDNAERMLNLVHTTQSMVRAKDAITTLPSTAGDVDYETSGSTDFFGDEGGDSEEEPLDIRGEVGSSSRSGMPSWAFSKHCDEHYFKTTLIQLINQTSSALQTTNRFSIDKPSNS